MQSDDQAERARAREIAERMVHDVLPLAGDALDVRSRARAQVRIVDTIMSLAFAQPRADVSAALEAAATLSLKLHAIHADPQYQSVWTVNQFHVGPYCGPNYTDELAGLDAALATLRQRGNAHD